MTDSAMRRAAVWARTLADPTPGAHAALRRIYGPGLSNRLPLLRRVTDAFVRDSGDVPCALCRSPGRLNLRGMHVDTHGGFLNVLTHQRETVAAAAARHDGRCIIRNSDPAHAERVLEFDALTRAVADAHSWDDVLRDGGALKRGDWSDYAVGAVLRVLLTFRGAAPQGIDLMVGGDVPAGASLSSSSSLCTAILEALGQLWNAHIDQGQKLRMVQDAEWFTGARIGLSDQAAMLFGRPGKITHGVFRPGGEDSIEYIGLPPNLSVLVINTFTDRQLRGEHLLDYTRNRFAYSMALDVVRRVLIEQDFGYAFAHSTRSLADITPERFAPWGGAHAILRVLREIPVEIGIDDLRTRCSRDTFESAYETYFGSVPEDSRPVSVALRGPLLFGIAESDRARQFAEAMRLNDGRLAGRLMNTGHDGDRVFRRRAEPTVDRSGPETLPWNVDVSDAALRHAEEADSPSIHWMPGSYRASSAVLDAVVDAALDAGALGASLTGAGIAGSVVALCDRDAAGRVQERLREYVVSDAFAQVRGAVLTDEQAQAAVVENIAVAGAGPLSLDPC